MSCVKGPNFQPLALPRRNETHFVCWLSIERIRAMSNVVVVVVFFLLLLCPFSFQQIRPLLHTHTHKDTLKRRIKKWSCASPSKWRIKTDRPADTSNPFIHLLSVSCLFIFWHFQFSHGVRVLGKRKEKETTTKKKNTQIQIIFIIFLINQTVYGKK
jgi:hypothetical protein